ncbi:MAG: YciI family protein [Candidatus Sumerlaeia bacterium]|nr:YciI family protein [Candidatus Sumerlaeia bacterium]
MPDSTAPNSPIPAGGRRLKGKHSLAGLVLLVAAATLLTQVGMTALPFQKAREASKGRLSLQLFAIESLPTGTGDAVKAVVPRHLEYLEQLEQEEKLFAAGPLGDPDSEMWSGAGLIVVRGGNLSEAKQLAENDPMHQSGARRFVIRPWLVNDGVINISLRLSNQQLTVE